MTVCVPCNDADGLKASLSDHFGRAPWFAAVDLDTMECQVLPNASHDHDHRQCGSVAAFDLVKPSVVVCRGMGPGAINRLAANGIEVAFTDELTVAEAIDAYKSGVCRTESKGCDCDCH